MVWVFKVLDFLRLPRVFEAVWRVLTRVSVLTEPETDAAASVFGAELMAYYRIRVAEGRILRPICRMNGGRAFTTFHTINLPDRGDQSRSHTDIVVHELVHVLQYERVGSVYIWQALRAQRTDGYSYGGWEGLARKRESGTRFRDFNREQQGQIVQDYYNDVVKATMPDEDPKKKAFEPYIDDMRAGHV